MAKLSSKKWKNSSFTKKKSLVGLAPELTVFTALKKYFDNKPNLFITLRFNEFTAITNTKL